MAKNALVIKGANFATNKVATVEFNEEIPCTAITLSDSTKTVTALGNFTLTATVTPNDTTDDVLWSTSDSSVATVSGGTVSVVGLGTATITATCGNQSATCVVTCNQVTIAPFYGFFDRANLTQYTNVYAYSTSKRTLLICSENANQETRELKNQTVDTTTHYAPILLPANTATVTLTYGSDMRSGTIKFGWCDTTESAYPETYPAVAELVELNTDNSSAYNQAKTWTYEKPSGADSFVIVVTPVSTDYGDSDTPAGIAQAKGIVVKALASVGA